MGQSQQLRKVKKLNCCLTRARVPYTELAAVAISLFYVMNMEPITPELLLLLLIQLAAGAFVLIISVVVWWKSRAYLSKAHSYVLEGEILHRELMRHLSEMRSVEREIDKAFKKLVEKEKQLLALQNGVI